MLTAVLNAWTNTVEDYANGDCSADFLSEVTERVIAIVTATRAES